MGKKNTGGTKLLVLICILLFATIVIAFVVINAYKKTNITAQPSTDKSIPGAIVTTYQINPQEKSNGNNAVATDYAQQLSIATEKAKPGLLSHLQLDLEPSSITTSDQTTYKNSVTLAKLTLQVNKNSWHSLSEEEKRALIATYMGTLRFSTNTNEGFIITDTKGNPIATGHK